MEHNGRASGPALIFALILRIFTPRYDAQLQLLTFQFKMLSNQTKDFKPIPSGI
jgi:hypothetical protein